MSTMITPQQLALDVLHLAMIGGMPSSYWHTDSRIARACEVLGVDVDFAEQYAEETYHPEENDDD